MAVAALRLPVLEIGLPCLSQMEAGSHLGSSEGSLALLGALVGSGIEDATALGLHGFIPAFNANHLFGLLEWRFRFQDATNDLCLKHRH